MISFKKPGTGIKENDLHLTPEKLKKDINPINYLRKTIFMKIKKFAS